MKKSKSKALMITGGASGIGAAIARRAVSRGDRVMIADIDIEGARKVAREIGEGAFAVELDITSPEQWERALDAAWRDLGRLDALINNAAIAHTGYARNLPIEAHRQTLDVNAMGPITGMMAVLPRFREQGSGHFVTVCSMTAFLPFPGLASYAAAKHALRAFHHGLSIEERHSPFSFSIIHPTSTETPMLEKEAASDEVPMAFYSTSVTADYVADVVLTAMDKKRLEVFMPANRARTVRLLGTDARKLLKYADAAEELGAANLAVRRSAKAKKPKKERATA
jgi:NAD(P)-dependent dehydrogenase (short-subunit alcohol dehydrogenase family)